jgi:hypothetical protein
MNSIIIDIIERINYLQTTKKTISRILKKMDSDIIINTEVRLGFTDTPVIPFIWHREQDEMCPIVSNGIRVSLFSEIKKTYKINNNIDDDEIVYVIEQNYTQKYNLYICLHSLMYYELHKNQVINSKLRVPQTYDKQMIFNVTTIPLENTKLIELPNGLKTNQEVSGIVYIHDESYSPPGTLHFQLDHTQKKHILLCNIKSFDLKLNIYTLFIINNKT